MHKGSARHAAAHDTQPLAHPSCAHTCTPRALHAQSWSLASFAAFFAVFSAVPALVEVLALMFVTKMAVFIKY